MDEGESPPRVGLRTAAERRLRFGPFPSVGDAMRFVAYAAVGALVIPWFGALAWLPILGVGFVLAVWQPGGVALDRRLYLRVTWWERALQPSEVPVTSRGRSVHGGVARVPPGYLVTVLKCGGRPIAFLPPQELYQKFRQYRELLRSLDGGIVLVGVGLPIDGRPWDPQEPPLAAADTPARAGYSEMVRVLCRHRQSRRVYALQWAAEAAAGAATHLEERTGALAEHLEGLGVSPVRLEGASLGAALTRFGWDEVGLSEGQ